MTRLRNQLERASRRLHDYTGREVTVVTRTETGRDSRNNRVFEDTEQSATGEIVRAGTPNFDSRVQGASADVDAAILLPDDVEVTEGDENRDASLIRDEHGGDEYRVIAVYREAHTGKYEVHTELL